MRCGEYNILNINNQDLEGRDKVTEKTLDRLGLGETGFVTGLCTTGGMRRRLRDLGFCNGTGVKCTGQSTHRDIASYSVKGAVIALRREDAATVLII